jgi:transketolase
VVTGAFVSSIIRKNGPTALILTRQNVRTLPVPAATKREGVLKGAYVLKKETGPLKLILMASGSEVQHAYGAAEEMGDGVRVVSVPSFEIFERQSAEYKESVLPKSCTKRVAVEAGVTGLWYKYTGLDGKVIGVDRFGFSAPGDIVMKELGMTKENVLSVAKAYM